MSPAEVSWRVLSAGRDRVDAFRCALGMLPDIGVPATSQTIAAAPPRLCDIAPGEWLRAPAGSVEAGWRDRLVARADAIAQNRISIFGRERFLGAPIRWNHDHERDLPAPLDFAPRIDYRDPARAGDAKIVWEPNRHHHLVVLARAYRVTGDRRYAAAVVAQLLSWLDQCPFPRGMNWRSPLELAIRLINWTWAIDFIRDADVLPPPVQRRLLGGIHLHLWDTTRKFSRGSSANNHLIGEAAGVFVACCYFPELDREGRWAAISQDILSREILAQTHEDGGTREQAIGYHLFVFQLLIAAYAAGRATGHTFPESFLQRLEKMVEFAGTLGEGGPLPMFGDADSGYVLDLGRGDDDLPDMLAVGAVLFDRADFKRWSGGFTEPARWLVGAGGARRFDAITVPAAAPRLESRALAASGYYVLQSGIPGSADSISAVFDCAPLGFTAIAAHGHADALSFTLRAGGADILVDPGTYDYFSYPEWRRYLKSTLAHNTVSVDDADQSVQLGSFLWGSHAVATCTAFRHDAAGGSVTGEHDGYRRLRSPVGHRRTLTLDAAARTLTLNDSLTMSGRHTITLSFHLAEACTVSAAGGHWLIAAGLQRVRLTVDPRLSVRLIRGAETPGPGWVSRTYHQREPAWTIAATGEFSSDIALECRLVCEPVAGRQQDGG